MKSTLVFLSLALCATASAAPKKDPIPAEAVLRVSIGTDHVTGIVVSTDGYVITSASFIRRCQTCAITVHDEGLKGISRVATLQALDVPHDLALLKTNGDLPHQVTFAQAAPQPEQALAIYAFTSEFRRKRFDSKVNAVVNARYSPEGYGSLTWEKVLLTVYVPENGQVGAGAFSPADGSFQGLVVGKTVPVYDGPTLVYGVISPLKELKMFLQTYGISTSAAQVKTKK